MSYSPGGEFTCDGCSVTIPSTEASSAEWRAYYPVGTLVRDFMHFCSDFCLVEFLRNPPTLDAFELPADNDPLWQLTNPGDA